MIRLVRSAKPIRHRRDVARMRIILNARGYDASDSDIQEAWEEHSEMFGAGWLAPDSEHNEDIFAILTSRLFVESTQ